MNKFIVKLAHILYTHLRPALYYKYMETTIWAHTSVYFESLLM